MLLAQGLAGLSFIQWVMLIIAVAGVIAILYIALRQLGITIPPWLIQVFWVVVVVVVCMGAARLIWSMF
jgi:hypothetical protein